MNKKYIKLHNLIFPIWLLWLIPSTWIIVLPANFLIDLLVVVVTLKCMKVQGIRKKAKSVILRVWLMGFVADFIGTAAMFLSNLIDFDYETPMGKWWYNNISNAVSYNPFDSIYAILWVTVCVILSAFFIFLFNYKFCLKKADLSDRDRRKLALSLAIVTAPYLFYLPTAWLMY